MAKTTAKAEPRARNWAAMRDDRVKAMAENRFGRTFATKAEASAELLKLPAAEQRALKKVSVSKVAASKAAAASEAMIAGMSTGANKMAGVAKSVATAGLKAAGGVAAVTAAGSLLMKFMSTPVQAAVAAGAQIKDGLDKGQGAGEIALRTTMAAASLGLMPQDQITKSDGKPMAANAGTRAGVAQSEDHVQAVGLGMAGAGALLLRDANRVANKMTPTRFGAARFTAEVVAGVALLTTGAVLASPAPAKAAEAGDGSQATTRPTPESNGATQSITERIGNELTNPSTWLYAGAGAVMGKTLAGKVGLAVAGKLLGDMVIEPALKSAVGSAEPSSQQSSVSDDAPQGKAYLNDAAAAKAETVPEMPSAPFAHANGPQQRQSDGETAAYTRISTKGLPVQVGSYATPKR